MNHEIKKTLLRLDRLSVRFHDQDVLSSISFDVKEGEIVGVIGVSGTGKTTLLRAIAGIFPSHDEIVSGTVSIDGSDFLSLSNEKRREFLGQYMTVIPQNPQDSFCPVVTIGKFMRDTWKAHDLNEEEGKKRFFHLLLQLDFSDPEAVWNAYPHQLSGGMCQRIAVASALVPRPKLVLADEPVSGLDGDRAQRAALLFKKARDNGTGFLIVTHQLSFAARTADRIIVMNRGHIEEENETSQLFQNPKKDYTKLLLASSLLKRKQP